MMDKVRNLINDNDWKTIYNMLKNDEMDPYLEIINGNTIGHLAAINNKKDIILYLCEKDKIIKGNSDGNTIFHLLAIYGYEKLLKTALKACPYMINNINNKNETLMLILYNNDIIIWCLDNIDNIDINIVDNVGKTLLSKNISECKEINDTSYKIIKHISQFNPDLNIPINNPIICNIAKHNKGFLLDLFPNANVNIYNDNYISPLLFAAKNLNYDLMKQLIDMGANIHYSGPEFDFNLMKWAIMTSNERMINFLLEYNFNMDIKDRFFDNPIHVALYTEKIAIHIISTLLHHSNLNNKNLKGETPLHLICKYHNWENYKIIMKNKDVDIFITDCNNNRAFDYLNTEDFHKFLNWFQKNNKVNKIEYIKLVKGNYTSNVVFNSDIYHSIIYLIIMLKKYKNLIIPYQHYNQNKYMYDRYLLENNNCLSNRSNSLIIDIINTYVTLFYELSPYIIVWKSKDIYHIDKYIDLYLLKCLNNEKYRFILLKLSIITKNQYLHANIIIFDKQLGILERFEPYGILNAYNDYENLDNFIAQTFKPLFSTYLLKHNKEFIYLTPHDLYKNVGFQILSNDTQQYVKKQGDPGGFCLAWTFWYLEMRLNNPQIHPNTLISNSIDKIVTNDCDIPIKKFINFIRNYASKLDNYKNMYLIEAGISENNVYDAMFTDLENEKIIDKVLKDFYSLII